MQLKSNQKWYLKDTTPNLLLLLVGILGRCCYAFARVGTWNFSQLLLSWHLGEGVVMLLLCFCFGQNLELLTSIEEGGDWDVDV
jgi:hypothetical protein